MPDGYDSTDWGNCLLTDDTKCVLCKFGFGGDNCDACTNAAGTTEICTYCATGSSGAVY